LIQNKYPAQVSIISLPHHLVLLLSKEPKPLLSKMKEAKFNLGLNNFCTLHPDRSKALAG